MGVSSKSSLDPVRSVALSQAVERGRRRGTRVPRRREHPSACDQPLRTTTTRVAARAPVSCVATGRALVRAARTRARHALTRSGVTATTRVADGATALAATVERGDKGNQAHRRPEQETVHGKTLLVLEKRIDRSTSPRVTVEKPVGDRFNSSIHRKGFAPGGSEWPTRRPRSPCSYRAKAARAASPWLSRRPGYRAHGAATISVRLRAGGVGGLQSGNGTCACRSQPGTTRSGKRTADNTGFLRCRTRCIEPEKWSSGGRSTGNHSQSRPRQAPRVRPRPHTPPGSIRVAFRVGPRLRLLHAIFTLRGTVQRGSEWAGESILFPDL